MPLLPFSSKTLRATTQAATDNSTLIATDAFVTTAVNNAISGVNPAVAVGWATTAAANTSGLTYSNGASGVGATFTGANNTATTIDGHTFVSGDVGVTRLLVKNDTQSPSGAFNGIYLFTALHTSITGDVFTRSLDYDQPSDINNTGAIPVVSGTVNAQTSWVETANITTVGTTPLAFAQFTLNPTTVMTTSTYDAAAIAQQVVGTTASQALTNKSYNGLTLTSTTGTFTLTNGKTLSVSNTLTLAGTDSTTMTFPATSTTVAGLSIAETFTATQTFKGLAYSNNAVTVSSNAGTCSVSYYLNTFTNSSAATMAITIATAGAVDGQPMMVRIYDFSGVAETIGWTNTENSSVSAPLTSNGSTTLPLTVGFIYNGQTSKWRCVAYA